ncbi:MAG: VF530 family DNA-binding protein [Gammaproteobacteria bacterium]|nr:VF530 family DNA-binding protein [Gammaproteobacteria bacterium]
MRRTPWARAKVEALYLEIRPAMTRPRAAKAERR